jgi:hypothetical protein
MEMKPVAVIGLMLVLVGAVLWVLPISTNLATNVSIDSQTEDVLSVSAPLAVLTFSVSFSASWTAVSPVNLTVFGCGSDSSCSNVPGNASSITNGSGRTGELTWSGPRGAYFAVLPSGPAVLNLSYEAPLWNGLAGVVLLVLGVGITIAGFMGRGKERSEEPPAPPVIPG